MASIYTEILTIDENQLDKEWINQPNLVFKFSKKQASARKEMDAIKNEIEVVKADLDKQLRLAPEAFGILKVTESAISSAIVLQPQYQEVQNKLNNARYELDIYTAMVNALEHKKRALESLVSLHGQNYFSTPKADDSAKEFIEEGKKKTVRKSL